MLVRGSVHPHGAILAARSLKVPLFRSPLSVLRPHRAGRVLGFGFVKELGYLAVRQSRVVSTVGTSWVKLLGTV